MRRFHSFLFLFFTFGTFLCFIILGHLKSVRFDATKDKEFTLSEATKTILDDVSDILTIKWVVTKDLPPLLNPLKFQVQDLLAEIKANTKESVVIEEFNPSLNQDQEAEALAMGITPVEINVIERDKQEVKKIYFGLSLQYKDKQQTLPVVVNLGNLEYHLALAIAKLLRPELPKLGVYIDPASSEVFRIVPEYLAQLANVSPLMGQETLEQLKNFEALLLINPVEVNSAFVATVKAFNAQGKPVQFFTSKVFVDESLTLQKQVTGFESWLEEQGLTLGPALVVDPKQNELASFQAGLMQVHLPYPFFIQTLTTNMNANHPATHRLESMTFAWSTALTFTPNPLREAMVLASSSANSFVQKESESASPQYLQNLDSLPESHVQNLSVVLNSKTTEKAGPIYVTASSQMLTDAFLNQHPDNALFLANVTELNLWGQKFINIRTRGQTSRPLLPISENARLFLRATATLFTPVFLVLCGLAGIFILKIKRQKLISVING